MTNQVVLLRAVNVGGRGKVSMTDLRTCFADLGFHDVRTLLQSGNVVLRTDGLAGSALEKRLESALVERFALKTDIMARSTAQWGAIISHNPFPEMARRDPSHLVVMVAKEPIAKDAIQALNAAALKCGGAEEVGCHGSQVYITFPNGIGRSRLTAALIERNLGTKVTGRNWNTVLKLLEMIDS